MTKYQNNIRKNLNEYFKIGTRTNKLKIEKSATFQHEATKALWFTKLVYYGATVVCNGKLKNGKIPE